MGSHSHLLCASLLFCWLLNATGAQSKFDGFAPKPTLESPRISFGDDAKNIPSQQQNSEKSSNPNERFGIFLPPHYPGAINPGARWSPLGLTVELSPDTRLSVRPNEAVQLTFEVINYRDLPQGMSMTASDTAGLIRIVAPLRVIVPPRGSTRVVVELFPGPENTSGLVNKVTLAAQTNDGGILTRAALVRVRREAEDDDWDPQCSFSVPSGQCREQNYNKDSCVSAGWNVEATLRDDLSGLLRVESSPPGSLLLPPKFVAGTRAPVTVLLAASCCQDKITLRVWDANGNSRSCEAYVHGLTPGEIAAIVLGCLLFLAIIGLIVLAIILCRRKQAHRLTRRELPTRH